MYNLQEDKLKECKLIFDLIDTDKDGMITTKEVGDTLRICGAAPTEKELEEIIETIKKEGSTYLNFEAFIRIFKSQMEIQLNEDELIAEFKKMDELNNGKIKEKDFIDLLSTYGNSLNNEDKDQLIQAANAENGYIDYKKFIKVLLNS